VTNKFHTPIVDFRKETTFSEERSLMKMAGSLAGDEPMVSKEEERKSVREELSRKHQKSGV
jgi:hypothetical protein